MRYLGILVLLAFATVLLAFLWEELAGEPHDFPGGRDTVAYFGNGRFQILNGNDHLSLQDLSSQQTLAYRLQDWRSKGDWVYVLNREGKYLILNYRTASHQAFATLDDASPEHRAELSLLKNK